MSNNNTIKYLNSFVNRAENVQELLTMYMDATESRAGAIFVQQGCSNKHICIEHISLDHPESKVSFEPIGPIDHIVISKKSYGYIAPYDITNILTIPITVHNSSVGAVCLVNRITEYKEEMVNEMSPYISITQLILNKQKNINDYKSSCKLQTNVSKDLFFANMSHEIRTPLNGVIGYNQLLMQTELTSTQKGYLISMNQCSIQLMQIINDVLDFSKLSSGKMSVNTECFSPQEVIESVRGAMGQRINEKKQKARFIVGDEVPEFIIMDKQKLVQILVNLVSNAHKFTDIGGHIELSFHIVDDGFVQIAVKDNGLGISEQDQSKLFSAFEQIQASVCKTGTGLGLAICDKLVNLLGGNINIKSSLGLGSTFVVKVRYKPYEEYEKVMKRDAKLLKGKIVLVVDDNTDNRILLTELLFEWEMKPIVCASALEALRMVLANRYKFSIGLIDICMPGTTGSELAKQIKEKRPFFPLIALSSIDSFITSAEFEHKLDKPINRVQLFNSIHRLLSKRHTPSAFIGDGDCSGSDTSSPSSKFDKNSKIIVVEDILYNRTLLENMLQLLKYKHIDSVENGKIAFEMLQESLENGEPYDIILLDLRMPIMDGYEVIEAIKKKNWKLPKIVVITASVMEEDRNKCKELGIQYFINKPIELGQLKNVMLHVTELL